MGGIKAGVVVVTKFAKPGNSMVSNYIEYIDRQTAKREMHISEFNLYQDYMGNPVKTTDLFTKDSDSLNQIEKIKLKELFQLAQDRGSLMWQTVISFDNRWLKMNGLMSEDDFLDEIKIKEYSRNAINKMLKNENLEQAIWSAAIHYNTDNIHVHVATVEVNPTREKILVNGVEEYRGKFKQKSINLCKSSIVNQVIRELGYNTEINSIIRDTILLGKKSNPLIEDRDMSELFFRIYNQLPANRALWHYGNNALYDVRTDLDALSEMYLNKYHKEELENIKRLIKKQDLIYKTAYGDSHQGFYQNKIDDLYKRLGNAILKEIRDYDKCVTCDTKSQISQRHSLKSTDYKNRFLMEKAMRKLKQSMEYDYETWKNIVEHDREFELMLIQNGYTL